jgi:hypothetical protein
VAKALFSERPSNRLPHLSGADPRSVLALRSRIRLSATKILWFHLDRCCIKERGLA